MKTVLCSVFTLFKTARQGMGGVEELGNEVRRSQLGIKREQDLSFSPFFFVLSFLCEILRRAINYLHYDNRNDDENNRRAISLQTQWRL